MWNDNETIEDLIDFSYLKGSVNNIINDDDLLPSTIGVFGDWGSGKSSLIQMIEKDHIDKSDELIIKFNGWLFEGFEDAKIALLETLIEGIIKARRWDSAAIKSVKRLAKKVKWLKAITNVSKFGAGWYLSMQTGIPLEGLGVSDKPFDIKDYYEETSEKDELISKGIREFHNDFSKLIGQTGLRRVIVIIDDLDRCTPPTVIATLEAIKLFLFVDKTVFIIAADERLINYAVKSRFPNLPTSDYDVSQDYLEKLIQIPIRILPLNQIEYETYINLLFAKKYTSRDIFDKLLANVFKKNGDPYISKLNLDNIGSFLPQDIEELKEDLLLTKLLNPLLVQILKGNPRQCKRFFNMLIIRVEMAKSKGIELKKKVLAKLMLLEYFKPESFNLFVKEINNSDGNILELLENDDRKWPDIFESWKNDEWINRWLTTEPRLGDEELKDYLYFIRTKVLEIKQSNRLSAAAKDILIDLLDKELVSKAAIKKSTTLSETDKLGILSELFDRYFKAEGDKLRSSISKILYNYVKANESLISEYIAFLDNLPLSNVVPAMVTHLVGISNNSDLANSKRVLLTNWAGSSIKSVSTAAKNKLKTV